MSTKLIFDNFHENIELSYLEFSFLFKNPVVNRLHYILQNSTAYHVFPCCKTSRFEHSIGVLYLTSKVFNNGLHNSSLTQKFVEDKTELILEKIREKETNGDMFSFDENGYKYKSAALQQFNTDSFCHIFNKAEFQNCLIDIIGNEFINRNLQVTNYKIDIGNKNSLLVLFQAIRIFGLFHDAGHMPFSHLFEFALENVRCNLQNKEDSKSIKEYEQKILNTLNNIGKVGDYPDDQIHEIISKNLTRHVFTEIKHKIVKENIDNTQKGLKIFGITLIEITWEEIIKGRRGNLYSLYNIVSGTVDSDRMDYVQRDGYMSGIIKSTGNLDRIIKLFCLCSTPDKKAQTKDKYLFLPSIQSLHDVEELLRDRYTIFKYMINHHAVKRSDFILQKCIENKILYDIENEVKYSQKSLEAFNIMDTINILSELVKTDNYQTYKKVIYQFTQLTDHWLLTLFSHDFHQTIIEDSTYPEELTLLLSELYENRRNFKSLWKRNLDYDKFVESISEEIFSLKTLKLDFQKIKGIDNTEYINEIRKCFESTDEPVKYKNIGYYFIEFLREREPKNWTRLIKENIENCNEKILITPVNISIGIKDYWLVDNKDINNISGLNELSTLKEALNMDYLRTTKFFVYYNLKENSDVKEIQKKISDSIIQSIKKIFLNLFKG